MIRLLLYIFGITLIVITSSCNNGGDTQPPKPDPVQPVIVSGNSIIINAVITVYNFVDAVRGNVLVTTTTDDSGNYTATFFDNRSYPLLICVTSDAQSLMSKYIEPSSGVEVYFDDTQEICAVINTFSSTNTVHVSFLTHQVYALTLYLMSVGADTKNAITNANQQIVQAYFPASTDDSTSFKIINLADSSNATARNEDILISFVHGAISRFMEFVSNQNNSPVHSKFNSFLYSNNSFSELFQDGVFNGIGDTAISLGQVEINTESYRHRIADNIFIFSSLTKRYGPMDVSEIALALNNSSSAIFGGVTPVDFSTTQPLITNISVGANDTLIKTPIISADIVDVIYGIRDVEFTFDDTVFGTFNNGEPYAASLDSTKYSDSADHILTLTAFNWAGGVAVEVIQPIVINNNQILIGDINPSTDTFVSGGGITLTGTVSDPVFEIADVSLWGQTSTFSPFLIQDNIDPTNISHTWDITFYFNQPYTFTLRVTNVEGYTRSKSVTYTIDNISPSTTITNLNDGDYIEGNATLQFTVSDNNAVASAKVFVNGLLVETFTPNVNSDDLTSQLDTSDTAIFVNGDAPYTLVAEAADSAGNITTDSRDIVVDTVPPTFVISSPNDGQIITSDYFVIVESISLFDSSGIAEVVYYIDSGQEVQMNTLVPKIMVLIDSVTSGSHTVYVRVTDNSGKFTIHSVNITVVK